MYLSQQIGLEQGYLLTPPTFAPNMHIDTWLRLGVFLFDGNLHIAPSNLTGKRI